MTPIHYKEYKDSTNRFTLEVFIFTNKTIVKMFNLDKEEFIMEYDTESPIVKGAIGSLIKMMNNEFYQYN